MIIVYVYHCLDGIFTKEYCNLFINPSSHEICIVPDSCYQEFEKWVCEYNDRPFPETFYQFDCLTSAPEKYKEVLDIE